MDAGEVGGRRIDASTISFPTKQARQFRAWRGTREDLVTLARAVREQIDRAKQKALAMKAQERQSPDFRCDDRAERVGKRRTS